MTATQNTKLVRAVKTVIDLVYWLLVGACVFLILWIAIAPLIMQVSENALITASVPVAIGSGGEPRFDVQVADAEAEGISSAFVDEAHGTLRLETRSWGLVTVSNLAKLVTAIGLAYVFYLLRQVMQAILQGETFTAENAERIRRIGYLILLVGFLRPTVEYIAANVVLNQLTIIEPALSLPSIFKAEVILGSLLILVLAQVWSYGLELERDQALTI
jgi:hypothetical protein